MTRVGLRGRHARRAQTADAISSAAVADVPVVARICLPLELVLEVRILSGVWLVLALECAGGWSFVLTRTAAPMRWVVIGLAKPVSYRSHNDVDLSHGGSPTPNRVPLGPLIRSLPHTLKEGSPPVVHAMQERRARPTQFTGPTRTSSTKEHVPRREREIPLQHPPRSKNDRLTCWYPQKSHASCPRSFVKWLFPACCTWPVQTWASHPIVASLSSIDLSTPPGPCHPPPARAYWRPTVRMRVSCCAPPWSRASLLRCCWLSPRCRVDVRKFRCCLSLHQW